MSNALDRLRATTTVLSTGFFWLRLVVMWFEMAVRAETVNRCFLNPCWCSCRWAVAFMSGRMHFTRILAEGQSRVICL